MHKKEHNETSVSHIQEKEATNIDTVTNGPDQSQPLQDNPPNKEKTIEQKEVDLQRYEWQDDLKFGFNINEVSLANVLDKTKEDNLVLYPLYQLSASVSLGSFTNNKRKRGIEEIDVRKNWI